MFDIDYNNQLADVHLAKRGGKSSPRYAVLGLAFQTVLILVAVVLEALVIFYIMNV